MKKLMLGDFEVAPAGGLNALIGGAIGIGSSVIAGYAYKSAGVVAATDYTYAVAAGVPVAIGAVMMVSPKTRRAGLAAIGGGLVAALGQYIYTKMSASAQTSTPTIAPAPSANSPTQGAFGLVTSRHELGAGQPVQVLSDGDMGLVTSASDMGASDVEILSAAESQGVQIMSGLSGSGFGASFAMGR